MKKIRIIFINGFISSITGIIMNTTGVWLNIYITKSVGSEVMGHFQLIMSVCTFALTFAVSGISFASMRLVAEGLGRKNKADLKKTMLKCFLYALVFGITGFILLYSLSDILSAKFINYPGAPTCLKVFSISLPAVALLSAISGYFTAVRRVYKDSFVKILVQIFRLILTIILLSANKKDPCITIMYAAITAELTGTVISVFLYYSDRKKHKEGGNGTSGKILPIALPIALSTYLRSGIMTVKNLFVPAGLIKFGMSPESATSAFGLIHGIVLPAVLFPSAFLFSFSALSVPELARVYSENGYITDSRRITYMINRCIQLTMLFSMFASVFILVFSENISNLISGIPETRTYISILALIIPIMYLDNTIDNMLKGLNEQVSSMKFNIIDSSISLFLVITLLPKSGIYGYVFIIILGEILNFIMSIRRLKKISSFSISIINQVIFPAAAAVCSCIPARVLFPNAPIWINLILCVIVYYILSGIFGTFSKEDRIWLKKSL